MAFGRGGAGNIQAAEQQKAQIAADIEANIKPDEPLTDRMAPSDQQYALTGRGGMGNYYVPAELAQTGTFNGADRSHIIGDGTLPPADNIRPPTAEKHGEAPAIDTSRPLGSPTQPATEQTRVYGRGGAGNFVFGVSESEVQAARKRRDEEEQLKSQLAQNVERGVQEALAPPPKARVPHAKLSDVDES